MIEVGTKILDRINGINRINMPLILGHLVVDAYDDKFVDINNSLIMPYCDPVNPVNPVQNPRAGRSVQLATKNLHGNNRNWPI